MTKKHTIVSLSSDDIKEAAKAAKFLLPEQLKELARVDVENITEDDIKAGADLISGQMKDSAQMREFTLGVSMAVLTITAERLKKAANNAG